jgi:hypothetical protein
MKTEEEKRDILERRRAGTLKMMATKAAKRAAKEAAKREAEEMERGFIEANNEAHLARLP